MLRTTAICYRSTHKIHNNCSIIFTDWLDTMSTPVEAMI